MAVLKDKKVLLAVCGGIAAYKSPYIVRHFIKEGAEVKVILTPSAKDFVSPLTLSTLSKNEVHWTFVEDDSWNNHVDLALWADLMIIAPATASTISKMVDGQCDNLVMASYLSAKCPVYIAPAMDLDMYKHPSTAANLDKLRSYKHLIIEAQFGELASGLHGQGRMAEPKDILSCVKEDLLAKASLNGKTVLISAGPTYEYIDPVRFIGNISSGKMGYALAEEALKRGAKTILVSGPVSLKPAKGIELEAVVSAKEMCAAMLRHYEQADIVIMAAAVADYTPKETHSKKIKKGNEDLSVELEKTTDILKLLGEKKSAQYLLGFALETNDGIKYATDKLKRKNLDAIVLNSLEDEGAGFKTDTNKISIIAKNDKLLGFDLKSKLEVAKDILNFIESNLRS